MDKLMVFLKNKKKKKILFLIVFLVGFFPLIAMGNVSGTQNLPDSSKIEGLLDSYIPQQIKKDNIPGMVFVMVKDGEIILSKGYGFANLETKTRMDAQKTLLYLASVTKTFTAASVLKLVDNGKLDLTLDVNSYLSRFKIKNSFSEPITLNHLLTHTAGFDDKNIGYVSHDVSGSFKLEDYLSKHLPPLVMAPGRISSYSNYGFGLAGYLIELASRKSYSKYLEEHIFTPLSMSNSYAHLPLSTEEMKNLAVGYDYDYRTNNLVPCKLGYKNLPPAGSITTTGNDMAKFMIALMKEDSSDENRVISEKGQAKMFTRQFSHHPSLPGFTHGFYEINLKGRRILTHPGAFIGYSSQIFLIPSQKTGIFFASNRQKLNMYHKIVNKFVQDFSIGEKIVEKSLTKNHLPPGKDLKRFSGMYQYTKYSRATIEKIAIWDSQIKVESTGNNSILLHLPRNKPIELTAVGPLSFIHKPSRGSLIFKEDQNGEITHMCYSMPGNGLPSAFEKLSWSSNKEIHLAMVKILMFIYLIILVGWPLTGLVIRMINRKKKQTSKGKFWVNLITWMSSLLALAFLVGLDALIGNSLYRIKLIWGMTGEMKVLLLIPFLIIGLTAVVGFKTFKNWKEKNVPLLNSCFLTFVVTVNLIFIVFLINWNLLGFKY